MREGAGGRPLPRQAGGGREGDYYYYYYYSWVVSIPTCLDSVPAAEGYFLVRPDHSRAAAEIVPEFHAPERKKRNDNEIVSTSKRGEPKVPRKYEYLQA